MLRRILFLMAFFGVFVFAVLAARLFQLQILEHERYERLTIRQQLREAPSSASRGTIYDTNLNPLAISAMLTPFIQAQFCFIAIASSFKRA